MNSKLKVPCIPIEGSISWEDWLKGRRVRRESSQLVAPGINRRKSSSSDRRLKKLFNGERGLPFTPAEKLLTRMKGKAGAVLAASIFHFGTYTVGDVKQFLAKQSIAVRL